MNVAVDIKRRDLVLVSWHCLFRMRENYLMTLMIGSVLFAWECFNMKSYSLVDLVFLGIASLVAGFGALLCGFLVGVLWMLTLKRDGGLLGRHALSISPTGVNESTALNDSHHHWVGVRSVLKLRNYIVIVMKHPSAHILPRRAFASREEFDAFFAQATTLKQSAGA